MRVPITVLAVVLTAWVWACRSASAGEGNDAGRPAAPSGGTPREAFSIELEMDFPMHKVLLGDSGSPVVTCSGSIYAAWIDDELRTMIAKKSPDGTVATSVVFPRTIEDMYHVGPSIGIDRDGYIHLAGNMHNSPDGLRDFVPVKSAWQYVVSDRPEDISSFTFLGDDPDRSPPGRSITYPFFASDNAGELYLSFRHRVKYGTGWSPGIMAGAVARYDTEGKRWGMLGGTDYVHGEKTLFWTAKPGGGTAYQSFRTRIFFDRRNRMHLVAILLDRGGSYQGTHVAYACSDDGGQTLHRADGSRHESLPITLQNADIVIGPPWVSTPRLYSKAEVGVTPDGLPLVSFIKERDGTYISRWAPHWGWSEPGPWAGLYFVTDPQGIITLPTGGSLRRSFDGGKTWQSYEAQTGRPRVCLVDQRYLAATGRVRFRTLGDGRFRVWSASFDRGAD